MPNRAVSSPARRLGAIVQYTNGIVDFQQDHCIGCGYCMTGCPFNVPKFNQETKRVYKCTMCVDRTSVGLQPACVKACPTSCLQFGTKDEMLEVANTRVEQLKANGFANAAVYDPPGVGGTSVVYGARVRRPARAVRAAAKPDDPTGREALEGPAEVDRQRRDVRGSSLARPFTSCDSAARRIRSTMTTTFPEPQASSPGPEVRTDDH